MTLAATLKNSIEKQLANKGICLSKTDEKILAIMRDAQLNIWKLLIEDKILNGDTNIQLNLRENNNKHNYLHHHEYQYDLKLLMETGEGVALSNWLDENGLTYIIIMDEHDGMGRESWQTLSIKVK